MMRMRGKRLLLVVQWKDMQLCGIIKACFFSWWENLSFREESLVIWDCYGLRSSTKWRNRGTCYLQFLKNWRPRFKIATAEHGTGILDPMIRAEHGMSDVSRGRALLWLSAVIRSINVLYCVLCVVCTY